VEVERVSDDPPERVQTWVATVSEPAMRRLDLDMLLDLLRIEDVPDAWEPVANIAASEAEYRTLAGDAASAQAIIEAIVGDTKAVGRHALRACATRVVERLCTGPLARHVGQQLRTIKDDQVEPYAGLCQTLGPGLVRSLADALTREESSVAVRRLGGLLLGFGAAGRRSVEQLKNSSNPAVRRTAVTLLRGASGAEALSELASMLGDDDPAVQRESIHAIVEIGTDKAYAVLHRLLLEADTPRDTALMELVNLRDDKAGPLFAYVLLHSRPRGRLASIHLSMVEALGKMTPRTESVRALEQVLQHRDWWAPFRTTTLQQAAANSLRRLGTPEAVAVLEAAAVAGSRGARKAARAQIAQLPGREGSQA
jgi:HEAT repeat protein